MTKEHAMKKLSRFGPVVQTGQKIAASNGRYVVSCLINGTDRPGQQVVAFHTSGVSERDDLQSDYFCGSYWDNLTQAIRHAKHYTADDKSGKWDRPVSV